MSPAMAIVKELTERHERRIAELEAALRQIVDGPPGMKFEEAGGTFEKFACAIAYDALQKATPVT